MEHRIADSTAQRILGGIDRHMGLTRRALTPSSIHEAIREAGVVETGGVTAKGQPTHGRLAGDWRSLVVSAAATEPLLRTSETYLEKWPEKAALGVLLVAETWNPESITVAVPSAETPRFRAFLRLLKTMVSYELREVESWGGTVEETILALSEETAFPGSGVLVESAETLGDIADAAAFGRPVTRRLVACLGEVKRPSHVLARVGMSLRSIVELCGGPAVGDYRVLLGGPLHACLESDLDAPTTKTTDAILVLPAGHRLVEAAARDPRSIARRLMAACSGCGFCTELCPVHLMGYGFSPHLLIRQVIFGRHDLHAVAAQALLCSECGICELLACPKGLSPRGLSRLIKSKAKEAGIQADAQAGAALPEDIPQKRGFPAPTGGGIPSRTAAFGRKIPVLRLLQQLELDAYADQRPGYAEAEDVDHVELILGEPAARPLVRTGQSVREGDLVAEEEATGARVHASIHGRIRVVDRGRIVIAGQDG